MKTIILSIVIFVYLSLPVHRTPKNSSFENGWLKYQYNSNNNIYNNIFEYVFKDGKWWIFEYDDDGRLVNIYPAEE